MSSITTWAQDSNKDIFYRNDLLGKKWVTYKNGNEKDRRMAHFAGYF